MRSAFLFHGICWRWLIGALLSTGVFASCATVGEPVGGELVKIAVEAKPLPSFSIETLRTQEKQRALLVSGTIRRVGPRVLKPRSHLDVRLLDAGGAVVAKRSVSFFPNLGSRLTSSRTARFCAVFPLVPLQGAMIQVVQHRGTVHAVRTAECSIKQGNVEHDSDHAQKPQSVAGLAPRDSSITSLLPEVITNS